MSRALLLGALLPAVMLVSTGCDANPSAVYPSRLSKAREISRVGVPGWMLVDTLEVRSIGENGVPRVGQFLNWAVQAGNGSLRLIDSVTSQEGYARALFTLGTRPGLNRVLIEGDGSTVTYEVKGTSFTADKADATWNDGCALRHGDLWCWSWGRTSSGPSVDTVADGFYTAGNALPTLISGNEGYIDLAVGGGQACVLTVQHLPRCFSANGSNSQPITPPLSSIVASDQSYYCGSAVSDSSTWCWQGSSPSPTRVDSTPFVQLRVSGGLSFASYCGLRSDSTAMCWGNNPPGDGSSHQSRPVPVTGGMKFSQLAMADEYSCGRRTNSEVWCWGMGRSGEIGLPRGVQTLVPVLVMRGADQIATGLFAFSALFGVTPARIGFADNVLVTQPTPFKGLENIPVVGFAKGSTGCVMGYAGQVYCVAEHWNNSSLFLLDRYVSVQPIPEQADE